MRHRVRSVVLGFGLVVLLWGAGAARGASPFFFIQLTDPQLGFFTANADFEQEEANLEFAVATVNRLRPAFVVVTGDLVHEEGNAAQIAAYLRIIGQVDRSIPVYQVAGNHDVGNQPTPESVAAYRVHFGPDFYTFKHGNLLGIVLNSCLIHAPDKVRARLQEQRAWLERTLKEAREPGIRHAVIFQHHPWFLSSLDERDTGSNLPRWSREEYLPLFREHGVRKVFGGHYHRNAIVDYEGVEIVTTGPVGKPLGRGDQSRSGLRVVIVRDDGIEHEYYDFGRLPTKIVLSPAAESPPAR